LKHHYVLVVETDRREVGIVEVLGKPFVEVGETTPVFFQCCIIALQFREYFSFGAALFRFTRIRGINFRKPRFVFQYQRCKLATPLEFLPVGVCLFVVCGIADIGIERVVRAVLPFLIWQFVVLMLVTYIPELALWVPRIFGYD